MAIFYKKSQHILIHIEDPSDWILFYTACAGYLTETDFAKIISYLKDNVKTIILEKNYVDTDYRDTYYNFFARKFAYYPNKTIRANFFSQKIPPKRIRDLDKFNNSYIGFIVIRPNRVSSIGRTVLDPNKIDLVKGCCVCIAHYAVHILGAELTVSGFPYMSQDTDVTICAHAACWMVFRYFSQRYTRYAEIWPYEVTQLTQDVSTGRLVPSKGLTAWQINEMFSKFGFYPEIYDRRSFGLEFDRLLYTYIESGLPVIGGLTSLKHAITVVGHISDYSNGTAGQGSDQYITGLVANDDNFMPYYHIRKQDPKPTGHWADYKTSDIDFFIVPLYEKIHLSAEHVIVLANAILKSTAFGIDGNSKSLAYNQIITRIFLTSSKSYKLFRRKHLVPCEISAVYGELAMPKFIWICEISTPPLYATGKILGEIIFDATANQRDRFSFLAIHYPDFLLLNDRNYLTDDRKRFIIRDTSVTALTPYECYINNLHEV